jgi:hypothetical protein
MDGKSNSSMTYTFKRILPFFIDLSVATKTTINTKNIGFEPTEVRVLQYGATNGQNTTGTGILICDELKDFNLAICCGPNTATNSPIKMSCPTTGTLSSLTFTFTVNGYGVGQVTQNMQILLVLEFLRK